MQPLANTTQRRLAAKTGQIVIDATSAVGGVPWMGSPALPLKLYCATDAAPSHELLVSRGEMETGPTGSKLCCSLTPAQNAKLNAWQHF